MKKKFASSLALLLALTFVALLVTQVAATDCDKDKAAQAQADQKAEVKAKGEEEQGKTTADVKKLNPTENPTEEKAKSE